MARDFYEKSVRKQWRAIEVARQQSLTALAEAKNVGDSFSGAEAIQNLADLDAQARNLQALQQQYYASQAGPPPLTEEERFHKPLEKMDYNDALALARTSRYGRNLTHDDPAVRSGYAEVARRRQAEGKR
jgi:hypothetical protein